LRWNEGKIESEEKKAATSEWISRPKPEEGRRRNRRLITSVRSNIVDRGGGGKGVP